MASSVSVLIVNYNGRGFLGQALEALAAQSLPPAEVIVVDNASADGSAQWLRDAFPAVRLIALSENVGFAEGSNRAAAAAAGELLALLNSDAVPDRDWLAESVRLLDREPHAAAVVPKILSDADPGQIEQAGALFNNVGNYWGRGFGERDAGQYEHVTEVPGLTACAVVLRRSAIGGAALFDPALFMYGEEFDLSLRLRAAGHAILYAPAARVRHLGMQSIRRASLQPLVFQQFYCNRNRVKLLAKYYPAGVLLRSLPLILLSLAYWNAFFLRHAGPRYLGRAVAAQLRYAAQGMAERRRGQGLPTRGWLPWMRRMGMRELWAMRSVSRSPPTT